MEGSIIADRYIINGIIGSGGMAIVYRGYDRDTGEEVAVKVLRSEFMRDDSYVRRFEKESQIAVKYSHKNIVKTIEAGCKDGRHYIVMEYISGLTLKEYIAKHGRVKPAEVVRIGRQICDALFYAHSHQLIHRDIKPQNILLTAENTVKVADFGIAKAPETSTVTISGSNVLGSVHYISPEQARGGITDEKADIYSIGIVFYEMVTGVVPFTGDSPVAVALKHLQDPPRPPREIVPDIPKALELVILKAISKEQACRYDNAREMARDLERSILEPEGSYIKIKQPDETDGTRPMHPIKMESLQMQQTSAYSNTGPSRRPQPPRQENKWRKKRNPPAALNVLLAVLLAVVLLGGAYLGFRMLMDSVDLNRQRMPDFYGKDINIVKQQLDKLRLEYVIEEEPSDSIAKDTVIGQSPAKDEYVNPGENIVLTVSSGRRLVDVPSVIDMNYQDAMDLIKSSSLNVGRVGYEESEKPKDSVVRQTPEAGKQLAMGGKVDIWLSRPLEPSVLLMPNVFGMKKAEAISYLKSMNITVSKVIPKASVYLADIVIDQMPEADTAIDSNTVVEIYISNGDAPGYSKVYPVHFDVAADDTLVKIIYVDGEEQTTRFYEKKIAGSYDVIIKLDTMTLGEKTLIIYYNGVEFRRETVTFS